MIQQLITALSFNLMGYQADLLTLRFTGNISYVQTTYWNGSYLIIFLLQVTLIWSFHRSTNQIQHFQIRSRATCKGGPRSDSYLIIQPLSGRFDRNSCIFFSDSLPCTYPHHLSSSFSISLSQAGKDERTGEQQQWRGSVEIGGFALVWHLWRRCWSRQAGENMS